MDVSKDNSRASSVEHDAGSLKIETTSKNSSDDEDNSNTATNFEDSNKLRQRRGRKGKNNLKSLRYEKVFKNDCVLHRPARYDTDRLCLERGSFLVLKSAKKREHQRDFLHRSLVYVCAMAHPLF